MSMEDKLTLEEQALFDSLSKEKTPPKGLEGKIILELKSKKLLNTDHMKTNSKKIWGIGIAASIVFFIAGLMIGGSSSADITSGYVMLLHEDENFKPVGSEMEIFTEYAKWMGKMALNGINITGNELLPESTNLVINADDITVSNKADKISGYFIIDVVDQKEAQNIVLSSPHIKFGGTVELIKLSDRN